MKYKVGDKFLQEIEVGRIDEDSPCPYKMLPDGGAWSEAALDDLRRPDDMTAEEAWETIEKICKMDYEDASRIFGTAIIRNIIRKNTPQQAKAKFEVWEAEKEIKVGDEVMFRNNSNDEYKFFVTRKEGTEINGFSGFTGEVFASRDINNYIKTGRHIDIQGLLKQIGGAE